MSTQPSADSLLNRAKGRSITSISKQGIGAWLLSVSASFIAGTQSLTRLLLFPIDILIRISDAIADAIILSPLGVVIAGSEASARSVARFEFLGLPLGTVIVLFTFAIVALYLRQPWSSDFLPGTFTDFLGIGTEESDDEGI